MVEPRRMGLRSLTGVVANCSVPALPHRHQELDGEGSVRILAYLIRHGWNRHWRDPFKGGRRCHPGDCFGLNRMGFPD